MNAALRILQQRRAYYHSEMGSGISGPNHMKVVAKAVSEITEAIEIIEGIENGRNENCGRNIRRHKQAA